MTETKDEPPFFSCTTAAAATLTRCSAAERKSLSGGSGGSVGLATGTAGVNEIPLFDSSVHLQTRNGKRVRNAKFTYVYVGG